MRPIGLTYTEDCRDFGYQVVVSINIKIMKYRNAMICMSEDYYDGIKERERMKDALLSRFWRHIGAA